MFEQSRGVAVVAASDLASCPIVLRGNARVWHPEEIQEEAEAVIYRLAGVPLMVYQTTFAGTAKNTVFGLETHRPRTRTWRRCERKGWSSWSTTSRAEDRRRCGGTRRRALGVVRGQRRQHPRTVPAGLTGRAALPRLVG